MGWAEPHFKFAEDKASFATVRNRLSWFLGRGPFLQHECHNRIDPGGDGVRHHARDLPGGLRQHGVQRAREPRFVPGRDGAAAQRKHPLRNLSFLHSVPVSN